jgi:hypothetical protein
MPLQRSMLRRQPLVGSIDLKKLFNDSPRIQSDAPLRQRTTWLTNPSISTFMAKDRDDTARSLPWKAAESWYSTFGEARWTRLRRTSCSGSAGSLSLGASRARPAPARELEKLCPFRRRAWPQNWLVQADYVGWGGLASMERPSQRDCF